MNVVILSGRLTAAPALTTTPSGTSVSSVTIAVDRGYGENKQTDFIPLVVWKNTAVALCKYCHKGDLITVEGSLHSRNYTNKEGKKRTDYEVGVNKLYFQERKKDPADVKMEQPEIIDSDDLPF